MHFLSHLTQGKETSLATASAPEKQLLCALDVTIGLHPSSQFFRHHCLSMQREEFKKTGIHAGFFSTPLTVGTEKGKPDMQTSISNDFHGNLGCLMLNSAA